MATINVYASLAVKAPAVISASTPFLTIATGDSERFRAATENTTIRRVLIETTVPSKQLTGTPSRNKRNTAPCPPTGSGSFQQGKRHQVRRR